LGGGGGARKKKGVVTRKGKAWGSRGNWKLVFLRDGWVQKKKGEGAPLVKTHGMGKRETMGIEVEKDEGWNDEIGATLKRMRSGNWGAILGQRGRKGKTGQGEEGSIFHGE